ncbi:hypothetical protein GALMADRAFT_235259 [Galerina marginata CBS 339.88]|uniref:Uncharacterized protein n=1 Tax=Galerina marginata (strain CBS 339.88) TaxID=685588 RepID=A0A067TSA1_GALM3|nr:hypothetical protein GALMADRAFT_235259 [Galerina marginata CBS 339.88]
MPVPSDKWSDLLCGHLSGHASPSIIDKCLNDLQAAIRSLVDDENRITSHTNWKSILHHTSYVQDLVSGIFQVGYRQEYLTNILYNILHDIFAVNCVCFRQLLSFTNFLEFENVPYFVEFGIELPLANILGVSEELCKMFLIDNAHLIRAIFFQSGGTAQEKGHLVPKYRPMRYLAKFLQSALHGGVFHVEYRRTFIRLSQQALAFLINPQERLLSGVNIPPLQDPRYLLSFIQDFLSCRDISGVKFGEDPENSQNMQAFIEDMCAGDNWRKLTKPQDPFLAEELVILKWLYRQLDQDSTPPLVDRFRKRMMELISQIYDQHVFPSFKALYFSDDLHTEETWLASISSPPLDQSLQKYLPSKHTIPPYNISHSILRSNPTLNYYSLWLSRVQISVRITAAMEEWVHHPSFDRVKCYTYFLEYHLLSYTAFFHTCITDKYPLYSLTGLYDRVSSKYFALWFSYAYPSKKILVGLWTLRYLLRGVEIKWEPPKGFCSGAISFLEKHELDPTGELRLWLGGLTEREARSARSGWHDWGEEDTDE